MNGNHDEIMTKQIDSPSPTFECRMASAHQLGIEKSVERVNLGPIPTLAPLHDHREIKVDDLRKHETNIYVHCHIHRACSIIIIS